jgi:hypothetical protein
VFCPQGHAIAQSIQDNNPGEVFLVNIHVGGFAAPSGGDPDFRTPFGTGIANQSGLIGYPAGTVNRQNFPGLEQGSSGSTAMSRGSWNNASNQVMGGASYVNVAVEADINVQNNELTVHVEGYYTADSPQGTNLLNVALLQNNTKGWQTGGNLGDEYVHMHRLVHMVTGQWGVSIPTTTANTFVDETFTYTIPADYNGIDVELADLEVVAYIAETQQLIPSGAGAYPTYSGFTNSNDAFARYVEDVDDQCGFDITPSVNVQNVGSDPLTSLSINYSVNSGPVETYNWTGNITSLLNETIELPALSYTIDPTGNNTLDVTLGSDDNNANNNAATTFDNAISVTGSSRLILNTGNNGAQITWDIKNPAGDVLYSGGPYSNNQSIIEEFALSADCYKFEVRSANGTGGSSVVMYDLNTNDILFQSTGDFGFGDSSSFSSNGVLGVNDNNFEGLSIYPNPATSVLNINNAENSTIEVFNILGQVLYTKSDISFEEQIQVSEFVAGTYFVKITNGNAVKTTKFIKR